MFDLFIVLVIKILVFGLDYITLPLYVILQRPWIKWKKSRAARPKQINPLDPYSPWISLADSPKSFIDECSTMDEVITKTFENYEKDKLCLGYRDIINETTIYSGAKPITKYELTDYKWMTTGEVDKRIENIGKGLLINGVKSGQNVMILAETSIDWFLCEHSIWRIGATVATTYTSLKDEGIIHCINEMEVTHVLTSHQLLPRLIRMSKYTPNVKTIIYFGTNNSMNKGIQYYEENIKLSIISLSELEENANRITNKYYFIHRSPKSDDIAILVYTSGSTGPPKAIKITHKNIVSALIALKGVVDKFEYDLVDQTYIAYLPLAHVLEQAMEIVFFVSGMKIGYSSPNTLTDMGTAIREGDKGDATLLKPMAMAAVPIVLDRIRKGIYDKINRKGIIVRKIFDFIVDYKFDWNRRGFVTPFIDHIFCSKFRQLVGGQVSFIIVGGAPLSEDTQKLIKCCLNIKLLQGFGTTETSGAGCIMDPFDESLGGVGPPLLGQIKLIDWKEGGYFPTDKTNPRGEIVISSQSVSIGYFKQNLETNESIYSDPDGSRWFATGDIGEVLPNGTFRIIDRKKDLIKLQFGEYVSLGKIESEMLSNEFVDIICVFGEMYASYLVALIIPNQSSVIRLAKCLNVDYKCLTDLYRNQTIVKHISNEIRKHGINSRLNKYEIPKKIMLFSEEWSTDNGLLTPSFKIKRKNIEIKYRKQIDLLFNEK